MRAIKECCDKRWHRKIQAVYQKNLIAGSVRQGNNFLRERAETLLFQSFKQNWTKPWRTYCREQSYAGPREWITWPDKSLPSRCYDSVQIEILFWAWFVLGLDVMWASGQSSDCFREQNGERDVEKRHAGVVRNREHELSGKMLTQKCYGALCSHVSQHQMDIKHTLVQIQKFYAELVVCKLRRAWSFGTYHEAPKTYEPKESTFLSLTLEVCFSCCYENPACWLISLSESLWCMNALLLVSLAAEMYCCWFPQKTVQVQLQWEELSTVNQMEIQNRVAVGFGRSWEMVYQKHGPNHCQICPSLLCSCLSRKSSPSSTSGGFRLWGLQCLQHTDEQEDCWWLRVAGWKYPFLFIYWTFFLVKPFKV